MNRTGKIRAYGKKQYYIYLVNRDHVTTLECYKKRQESHVNLIKRVFLYCYYYYLSEKGAVINNKYLNYEFKESTKEL